MDALSKGVMNEPQTGGQDIYPSRIYLSDFGQSVDVLSIRDPHGPVFGAVVPAIERMSTDDRGRFHARIAETLGGQVELTPGEFRTVVAFRSGATREKLDGGNRPFEKYIFALGTRLDSEVAGIVDTQTAPLVGELIKINPEAQVADEGARLRVSLPIVQASDSHDRNLEAALMTLSRGLSAVHGLGLRIAGEDEALNAFLDTTQGPVFSISVKGTSL